MKHFDRLPEPDILAQHAARWNRQWQDLRTRMPTANFNWYRHEGQRVNQKIGPVLALQTQDHCSYCDAYPMGTADKTIDHFHPKSHPSYYHLAYAWENLFWACADCQKEKGEQFEENLLQPDAAGYRFQHYFIYNFRTHEIEPNPALPPEDQLKAETTIRIFNLKEPSRVASRRISWERWNYSPAEARDINDFPFRFIFE